MKPASLLPGLWRYWILNTWRSSVLLLLASCLVTIDFLQRYPKDSPYTLYLWCSSLLLVLTGLGAQLVMRRWKQALKVSGNLALNVLFACCCSIRMFLHEQAQPDHYADHLAIPPRIQLALPVDQGDADSLINLPRTEPDLFLFNGGL